MTNVLPQHMGLTVDGVFYRYTITKEEEADATVFIRNKYANREGYIYNREDNWDGLPGNKKVGFDPLASLLGADFGDGEIGVVGQGSLTDVNVSYTYKFDTCANPLSDPQCPGYADALYKYLQDNNLFDDKNNPYYNEYVQNVLNEKVEQEEEEQVSETVEEEENQEEKSLEDKLAIVEGAASQLADANQQQDMLLQLASPQKLDSYYSVVINGGVYNETIKLEDSNLPDNSSALRNLASDSLHRSMVRLQYDN